MAILAGSVHAPIGNVKELGPAHPDEHFQVVLILRRQAHDALLNHIDKMIAGAAPLTHAEYAITHSSSDADIETVANFAKQHGLVMVKADPMAHSVVLSGTVNQFDAAFHITLKEFANDDGSYRSHTTPIVLPDELAVEAVLGLDTRKIASPHFRVHSAPKITPLATTYSYLPTDVARAYTFPTNYGSGQKIALIELGGGYRTTDIVSYFNTTLRLTPPTVKSVSVDGATNSPTGSPSGPDGEVMLDIEVAGAIASKATIVVYFAPNTTSGFYNGISAAINDVVNTPSVVSISWGAPEYYWTTDAMTAYNSLFQTAVALGVSICVASGDNGSSDGVYDGHNHVDFPASSPYVLACGGTSLKASNVTIASEVVWNNGFYSGASGGGISGFFATPSYQSGKGLAKRGVPDVAGDADPVTGYIIRVDGRMMIFGGTSAVAPLWAALIARINSIKSRRIGFINPTLYSHGSAFRDIITGNNGAFPATIGYDCATGLGSPKGNLILNLF